MKKKVALHSLGCKVNAYETQAMGEMFKNRGYEIVPFEKGADIYVINTCTVTNIADRKSRQMLHKAKKMNENAIVVAVGCYAQAFCDDLKKDSVIDLIVGNDRKKEIVELVEKQLNENTDEKPMDDRKTISVIDINDTKMKHEYEELNIDSMNEHTRAYIKIQDGCNQFCTYCIIPYARGRVRSRDPENIMMEVDRLIQKGYKEIVLTGIHLSSYGIDFGDTRSERLIDVIKKIGEKSEIKRIRLGSLEPRIITDEFMKQLKSVPSFCPHFHLSLQSGCDETLKRMNRRYTTKEFLDGCHLIRKYYEDAAITTDVIVGFPNETEEEFNKSKEFLETVGFAKMHIFKYSKREGTKAAAMDGQIPDELKAKRSNELIRLDEKMHQNYLEKFVGRRINVLFEEIININGEEYYIGHTKEYVKVALNIETIHRKNANHTGGLENELVEVSVQGLLNNEIVLAIL